MCAFGLAYLLSRAVMRAVRSGRSARSRQPYGMPRSMLPLQVELVSNSWKCGCILVRLSSSDFRDGYFIVSRTTGKISLRTCEHGSSTAPEHSLGAYLYVLHA